MILQPTPLTQILLQTLQHPPLSLIHSLMPSHRLNLQLILPTHVDNRVHVVPQQHLLVFTPQLSQLLLDFPL